MSRSCILYSFLTAPTKSKVTVNYRDQDIKLNWKTLMLFSNHTWLEGKSTPVPISEIKKEGKPYFYIGRSDIKGERVYFLVSKNIIPTDQNSHIFDNKFFMSMGYNTEYPIPQSSVEKLQEIVRDAPLYVINKIQPVIIDGEKKWKGKRRNGSHTEPQPLDWIRDSFMPQFENFYNRCLDDKNINKYLPLPAGKRVKKVMLEDREHYDEENSVVIPECYCTETDVPYCFDTEAFCAFGNMANALQILGDDMGTNFFFINRHKNMTSIQEQYPNINFSVNGNQFLCALQIVREAFKYTIKNLGHNYKPWCDDNMDDGVVKYVQIHAIDAMYTHVICIYKNYIYDGTFRKCIQLSEDSMRWLAKEDTFHLQCYSIEPTKKLKRALHSKHETKQKTKKVKMTRDL